MSEGIAWRGPSVALVLAALGLAALAPQSAAQDAAARSVTIRGHIVDGGDGAPLSGAVVHIDSLDLALVSGPDGAFTIEDIALGTYRMQVTRFGYRTLSGDITVDRPGEFTLQMGRVPEPDTSRGPGRILGRVLEDETGRPMEDATITLDGSARRQVSDEHGRFAFEEVAPGRHAIGVEHLGYEPREDSLLVFSGRTFDVELRVPVDPLELGGLTVTAEARIRRLEVGGYYRRREQGLGRQWTHRAIEERQPMYVTDLLTTIPGVTVDRGTIPPTVRSRRTVSFGSATGCEVPVFLDGLRVPGFDLDDLDPYSIEAMEFYHGSAETPIEYSMGCGLLLVWLRY